MLTLWDCRLLLPGLQVKQDIVQTQRQLEIQQRRAAEEKENYQQLDCHMTQVSRKPDQQHICRQLARHHATSGLE